MNSQEYCATEKLSVEKDKISFYTVFDTVQKGGFENEKSPLLYLLKEKTMTRNSTEEW